MAAPYTPCTMNKSTYVFFYIYILCEAKIAMEQTQNKGPIHDHRKKI